MKLVFAGASTLALMSALSTQAFNFFQQKGGFVEAPAEALPAARRAKYEASGRNSKVLLKTLAP